MARVIVTGASGKIGRYVVAALVTRGHAVCGLYRTAPGPNTDVLWRQAADLSDISRLAPLLDGYDAVIHLAAELSDRSLMDAVNVETTRRLIATSHDHGIRYFGFASSIVVYGSPKTRSVDEETPRLDPSAPLSRQYFAEPYMLDYARTKAAGEIAIEVQAPEMIVDFYRPAVVTEDADLLAAADWSRARKTFAAYRRTQFIMATDVAAAIVHLMERGLAGSRGSRRTIEAYNIVDEEAGTYRSLFRKVYETTGDARFKVALELPVLADVAKDFARHVKVGFRYPLGMLEFSNRKLRQTGFVFPVGVRRGLDEAIAKLSI
jgi:nucleoside-diphosphate-sugar epimerase